MPLSSSQHCHGYLHEFGRRLLFLISISLAGESLGAPGLGVLPFEWSGHWGIYHRYGFSGWGMDVDDGLMLFDGNFVHWPYRFAFPFSDRPLEKPGEMGVQSALWYRRGDYLLDEFAFDIHFLGGDGGITRFQALKRSFEDQYALLGPSEQPGGTLQQNYRLLMKIPGNTGEEWGLSSAYFKTTDAIPTPLDTGWVKGASRTDRILTNGLSYLRNGERWKTELTVFAYSQRLVLKSKFDAPDWGADLVTYKVHFASQHSLGVDSKRFLEASGRYSVLSSDSLGNRSRLTFVGTAGFEKQVGKYEYKIGLGGAYVSPDRGGTVFDCLINYSLNSSNAFMFAIHHSLHPLPYQFSGKRVEWYHDFPPGMFNRQRPDPSAISQKRTIVRLAAHHQSSRIEIKVGLFGSRAEPHYFFENRPVVDTRYGYWLFLTKRSSDSVRGVYWKGDVNYFRDWWLMGSGISFLENRDGWGNGVQHEGSITLSFHEKLFRKRLDIQLNLWADFWIGRNRYVWDPFLALGFYDYDVVHSQDSSGILNFEIKGTVSTVEISFTMMNVLFAGRRFIRSIAGDFLSDEQLTFAGTPLMPPAGRLAYIAVRWHFRN